MSDHSYQAVVDGSTDEVNGLDEKNDKNEIISEEASVGSLKT